MFLITYVHFDFLLCVKAIQMQSSQTHMLTVRQNNRKERDKMIQF